VQIKARLRIELDQARVKMTEMLDDDPVTGLFRNALNTPNKSITGTNTTWVGHIKPLEGRLNKIQELLGLARMLRCDVTVETIEAATLFVPSKPGR
jgi:hypothetical protein